MTQHASILVIGRACVDLFTQVDRPVRPDEKLEARLAWCGGGGPAANAAVALRRLGHRVRLACSIGDDILGRIALEGLAAEDVELLVPPRAGSTPLAQIQAHADQRSVVFDRGSVAPIELDAAAADRWLADTSLLYVDGHEIAAASVLVDGAHQAGVPVLGDLGTLRPGVAAWLPHFVWAVASLRFAAAFAGSVEGEAQLDALAAAAPQAIGVGVSLGAHGGIARCTAQNTTRWRARKVGVVDSTGAGDAFHAGLADAFLQGMDPVRSLEWAATLGASVCRGPGGRKFLPVDRHDLTRFEARWPHRPEPAVP